MFSLASVPGKNIKAHPVRTVILMVITAAQVMSILTGLMLIFAMRNELQLTQARLGADVLVYPTQAMSKISKNDLLMQGTPVQVYKSRSMLSRLESCENIAAVSYQVYIFDVTDENKRIWITGYDPDTDFAISPWIAEGQNFKPQDGSVIIGSKVITSGTGSISVFQKDWPVSGHLLETGSELDEMVFVSLNTLSKLIEVSAEAGVQTFAKIDPKSVWSSALIRVDNKQNVDSVTNWINIYVRKVDAVRSEETLSATASGIQGQIKMIAAIALSAWLLLLLAMGIVQSILMQERKKELYVWYAIGASRSKLEYVILSEALLTHLCGAFSGAFLTGGSFLLFGSSILNGTNVPQRSVLLMVFFAIVTSISAGYLSAWLAVRHVSRSLKGQMLTGI